MKSIKSDLSMFAFLILFASCNSTEKPLSSKENEQIKSEVIASLEKHVGDIVNMDYNKVMPFYVKEDYVLFGDGKYWGDYSRIDDIWKKCFTTWKKIIKWKMKNHKVHVFSKNSAVDYVEWDHERVDANGDTVKGYGSWVWGMQRFPEGWKSVNAAVDHRYTLLPTTKDK
jgi:hypothetical protein